MNNSDFVGFVNLDDTLVSSLLVTDGDGTPVNADALPTFRIYGANGFVTNGACTFRDSGSISGATNESPIVITSANHGLTTGARVTITGVGGNTAANGTFIITSTGTNTFSLDGSEGNGSYTDGGTWNITGLYHAAFDASAANGFEQTESYQANFTYAVSATQQGQTQSFTVT